MTTSSRSGGDAGAARGGDDRDCDAIDSNHTSFPFLIFSPVIPSLSPSSSSSLPLGFLILDNEHDDLVLVEIRGAGTRDMD